MSASSVPTAAVELELPSGTTIPTAPQGTTLSGNLDGLGNAQTITATYQLTAPGGDWQQAASMRTYHVLVPAPGVTDTSGNELSSDVAGAFTVSTSVG